jgi:hypothetical protein
MLGERTLEGGEGAVEISSRRMEERSAAGKDREGPGTVERGGSRLLEGEDIVRLVELAGGDERLEQVAELKPHPRLQDEAALSLIGPSQMG